MVVDMSDSNSGNDKRKYKRIVRYDESHDFLLDKKCEKEVLRLLVKYRKYRTYIVDFVIKSMKSPTGIFKFPAESLNLTNHQLFLKFLNNEVIPGANSTMFRIARSYFIRLLYCLLKLFNTNPHAVRILTSRKSFYKKKKILEGLGLYEFI